MSLLVVLQLVCLTAFASLLAFAACRIGAQ